MVFLCEHHRHPRAYGGADDPENLVWLCSGCHDLMHRLATMVAAGKAGVAQDFMMLYLPADPAARERLNTLVKEVLKAKLEFGVSATEDDLVLLSVKVPRSVHARLKTLSSEYKHASGRKVGVATYAAFVLGQHTATSDSQAVSFSPSKPRTGRPTRFLKKPTE